MTATLLVSLLCGMTLMLFSALMAARVARSATAATRHAILAAAFATILLLPLGALVMPTVTIELPIRPHLVTEAPPVADRVATSDPSGRFSAAQDDGMVAPSDARSLPRPSLTSLLAAVWLTGVATGLIRMLSDLRRIRALRKGARRSPRAEAIAAFLEPARTFRSPVAVLAHDAIPGPVTFGLRRAAVLLPADAESWSNSALSRALVHELEHVRRRDWLIQLLARLVCVIYWFHPLVWTAERELLLNAERACDDAVLAHASTAGDDDATAYADQLVDLAKRLSTRHQPLLAMANRYDLAVRVRALLDARQSRGPAGAWLVATVACVAGALALAISPLRVVAQSAGVQVSGDRPRFEVVSVRPCDPSAPPVPGAGRSGGAAGASPGRLHLDCTNVWTLIRNAYVSYADGRYHAPGERRVYPMPADLPDWVSRERYTIEAKAEGEPATAVMLGPMLQGVLEERFKLKLHVEAREVPVYELVVAKGGAKLGPARLDVCVPYDMSVSPQPPLGPGKHRCNEQAQSRDQDGNYVYDYEAVTLAVFLSARGPNGIDPILGRPIVNRTGITGLVSFRWVAAADRGSADGYVSRLAREFERQFGLELREGTAKREFLVIDHVERPRLETATPLPVRGHR